jgi:predicted ATPase
MKLDIHVHTRKIKSGDAITRNIEKDRFIDILKDTDVKILAITNHNHFDLSQYEEFRDGVSTTCQIWPGIELDVLENKKKAHLIVICNPKNHIQFNKNVSEILVGKNPDTFTISLKETVEKFDSLDCIYIAHYIVKKPNLGDEELQILTDLVSNSKRILKESTNAISAGIYISHGHNSIYGSDVHNWDDYIELSKTLPDLRLPVESFEQFCLLLEKDEATINTILDKKVKENIEIAPFSAAEIIRLDIYNDINILFGSKGTGKTEILEFLSKYYNAKGHKTSVYKSNDSHLNDVFDIKGNTFNCEVSDFGIDKCEEDIEFLKEVTEEEVTSLNKYLLHFSIQETNKISQKLKIKNINQEDETQTQRSLAEITNFLTEFKSFRDYAQENKELNEYVQNSLILELIEVLEKIISQLKTETESKIFENKSIHLLNSIISTFLTEISKKTGQPPKPTKTGFADYSRNRIKIERAAKKVLENIKIEIEPIEEYAGSLGDKGELKCNTNLIIQNGTLTDSNFSPVKNVKKTPQKQFVNAINSISRHIHSSELFSKISELNEIESIETINSLSDLLLKNKHFTLNGLQYSPSNGESSMILLHKELVEDKDIYLIDEPEKSLGNDYINDVIVPLLKEKALLGKKVIIATHDANIAVRTLPYNSIYRLHDQGQYFTLTGNPFSNSLKCIYGSRPELNWKEISMKTLEGGKEAFGERGKIYGK